KKGHHRYGCPQSYYRGACSNTVKERADWLEDRLLFDLQREVLQPETLDYTIGEFQRQLTAALGNVSNQLASLKSRREEIKGELRNLADAAARAGYSPTLIEAISDRERELDRITQSLFAAEPDSVSTEIGRIREYVAQRLSNIRQL